MAYGTKYIMGFTNDLNELYEVYFEYKDFVGVPANIIGAIDAMVLRSTGGDENKLEPILGTECLLNIVVGKTSERGISIDDSTLTIYDLIAEHDNDIRISIYKDLDYSKVVYQGFVVVEDNSQPFLDPPFTLSVRALDGLGLLKQVDMVDANGDLFAGLLSVQDWLGNILYKTGQTLNLRIYFPFYPIAASSITPSLEQVFLNAITWQIGELTTTTDPSVDVFASEANDAYTALEAICRCFRARLFQQDGVWNFVSLYSYIDPNGFAYNESSGVLTDGVYAMTTTTVANGLTYDVVVGNDATILPVKDDQILYLKLATKWVKLNYTYDQSFNKICNQNIAQGDADPAHDGTIPSNVEDPNATGTVINYNTFAFDTFCYSHFDGGHVAGGTFAYPTSPPSAAGYIREVRDELGYPIDRYLVLEAPTDITYFVASKFLIDKGDILKLSFDWRTRDNVHTSSATTYEVAFIYLYGDDGTFWALRCLADGSIAGNPTTWESTDSNFRRVSTNASPLVTSPEIFDTNQWTNVSVNQNITIGTLPDIKVPVSGSIEVLFQFHNDVGGTEYWFKNISMTILPFLQGSYVALKGDYNFSSSSNDIKQTASEDVQISDSPKRYFKGALLQSTGELWVPQWHRLGVLEDYRFTQLMERIYFNNVKRIMQKIEGTFRGLAYTNADFEIKQAGYLNLYSFSDHPIPTKKFLLTSFEKDYGTGHGRCVFVEILEDQNDLGFDLPDTYKFQYLFQ